MDDKTVVDQQYYSGSCQAVEQTGDGFTGHYLGVAGWRDQQGFDGVSFFFLYHQEWCQDDA